MLSVAGDTARWIQLRAQRLVLPEDHADTRVEQVLADVVAVQAQELPAAALSIRVRSSGLTAVRVDQARQAGTILRTWGPRGTLHLFTREDALWLVPFFGPVLLQGDWKRSTDLGWNPENCASAIRLIHQEISRQGSLTRPEIVTLLKTRDLPSEGQAPIHLIFRAASQGLLCLGPDRDGQATYTLFEDWVGPLQPLPPETALSRLAIRYLQAYAPATPEDMAAWSGLSLKSIREAWKKIEPQLLALEIHGKTAWILKSQESWVQEKLPPSPVVRLLPRFDTYLLGYAGRDGIVERQSEKYIHTGGGQINAVVLANGVALGTWKIEKHGKTSRLNVQPFSGLELPLIPGLEAETRDIARFLAAPLELGIASPR